ISVHAPVGDTDFGPELLLSPVTTVARHPAVLAARPAPPPHQPAPPPRRAVGTNRRAGRSAEPRGDRQHVHPRHARRGRGRLPGATGAGRVSQGTCKRQTSRVSPLARCRPSTTPVAPA